MTEQPKHWFPLSREMAQTWKLDGKPLGAYLQVQSIGATPYRYDDAEVLARAEARRRENRRQMRTLSERHAAVVARCSGTLRAVAAAHAPFSVEDGSFNPTCRGCSYDPDGWDGGPGEWPCPTFLMIEEDPQ